MDMSDGVLNGVWDDLVGFAGRLESPYCAPWYGSVARM